MNTKSWKRILYILLCLCMVAGLFSTTALAGEEQTADMFLFMGVFETGATPITTFSNTDTITISSHLPGFDNLDGVGSLHFVPTDGGEQVEMYLDPNGKGMYYDGGYVWFELHGLYEYDWQTDAKGAQLSPGSYKIRFWAGETMYTSADTYTVTGSGSTSVTPPAASDVTPSAGTFSDVPADAYYADAVQWAVNNGITKGTSDTTFSPDKTCTQAEIITFLYRALGNPKVNGSNPYANAKITPDQYYYNALLWAAEWNVVQDMALDPDAPCTRGDVVNYMWGADGHAEAPESSFDDVPADSPYASGVNWAVYNNVTYGTGEHTFSPNDTCTRGQIATFLYRFYGD